MLAIVVGALAPTVAYTVVASSDRSQWVEVCSVNGITWVKADFNTAQTDEGAGEHGSKGSQHCSWCQFHGAADGLPPTADSAEPLPRQTDLPPAFYHAPVTSAVWVAAQSRGPPYFG